MQSFHEVRTDYGYLRRAVFKVPTVVGDVYMAVARTDYANSVRAVVEVDREKLFALWRSSPNDIHSALAHGDASVWRADYKFSQAANGFASGVENPVPLATVGFGKFMPERSVFARLLLPMRSIASEGREVPYVSFTNGVTRTIWLATFEAPYFPVECRIDEAEELHRLAGTKGCSWQTVDDLAPLEYRPAPGHCG